MIKRDCCKDAIAALQRGEMVKAVVCQGADAEGVEQRKVVNCYKCKNPFHPRPSQVRRGDYLCPACKRQDTAEYYAKRKAEGRPTYNEKCRIRNKLRRNSEAVKAKINAYRQLDSTKKRAAERARIRAQDPANAERNAARAAVSNALTRGKLIKGQCYVCGTTKTQAHHPDYSKPLEVEWLCRKHHTEVHTAIPRTDGYGGEVNANYFTKIPITEAIKMPPHSNGVEAVVNAWWAVTEDNCILTYWGSVKQCSQNKLIADLICRFKNHLGVKSVQLPCVYIDPKVAHAKAKGQGGE